jgi:hypothetical protein
LYGVVRLRGLQAVPGGNQAQPAAVLPHKLLPRALVAGRRALDHSVVVVC